MRIVIIKNEENLEYASNYFTLNFEGEVTF